MNPSFWNHKKVFITGCTGFKGSWLCKILLELGAEIKGYSLPPITSPSAFNDFSLQHKINYQIGDVRDYEKLSKSIKEFGPEIIIHLAAQSLVGPSYKNPYQTYTTNFLGTLNLLEILRNKEVARVFLNVTSDKCYDNQELKHGYNEKDRLGGFDPYSNSKACSEMVTSSYLNSFFNSTNCSTIVATARSGNVIGGGDWSDERLIPDIYRSIIQNQALLLRKPNAIRPWQHVLDPLNGYLSLIEKMYEYGNKYAGPWNFGPLSSDEKTVLWIIKYLEEKLKKFNFKYSLEEQNTYHETNKLTLDSSKARFELDWSTKLKIENALDLTFDWYINYIDKQTKSEEFTEKQIKKFIETLR